MCHCFWRYICVYRAYSCFYDLDGKLKNLAGFCELMFSENSWDTFVVCPCLNCFCGESFMLEACDLQSLYCGQDGTRFVFFFFFYCYTLIVLRWLGFCVYFPQGILYLENVDGSSSYCRGIFQRDSFKPA